MFIFKCFHYILLHSFSVIPQTTQISNILKKKNLNPTDQRMFLVKFHSNSRLSDLSDL